MKRPSKKISKPLKKTAKKKRIKKVIKVKRKYINEMTIEEFQAVRRRKWNATTKDFDSLVILPKAELHDSGYRLMDFVACKDGLPVIRLSGCSDVLNINGIGGYGKWMRKVPTYIPPIDWSVDCLPKSGLLRLFCSRTLTAGRALSSLSIYATKSI